MQLGWDVFCNFLYFGIIFGWGDFAFNVNMCQLFVVVCHCGCQKKEKTMFCKQFFVLWLSKSKNRMKGSHTPSLFEEEGGGKRIRGPAVVSVVDVKISHKEGEGSCWGCCWFGWGLLLGSGADCTDFTGCWLWGDFKYWSPADCLFPNPKNLFGPSFSWFVTVCPSSLFLWDWFCSRQRTGFAFHFACRFSCRPADRCSPFGSEFCCTNGKCQQVTWIKEIYFSFFGPLSIDFICCKVEKYNGQNKMLEDESKKEGERTNTSDSKNASKKKPLVTGKETRGSLELLRQYYVLFTFT